MQIYRINGQVTLNRSHPSFIGGRLLTAHAVGEELLGRPNDEPDLMVVWDNLGAGLNSMIAVTDGAEAAQAFRPELKPVDAYCVAILDNIHIDQRYL